METISWAIHDGTAVSLHEGISFRSVHVLCRVLVLVFPRVLIYVYSMCVWERERWEGEGKCVFSFLQSICFLRWRSYAVFDHQCANPSSVSRREHTQLVAIVSRCHMLQQTRFPIPPQSLPARITAWLSPPSPTLLHTKLSKYKCKNTLRGVRYSVCKPILPSSWSVITFIKAPSCLYILFLNLSPLSSDWMFISSSFKRLDPAKRFSS